MAAPAILALIDSALKVTGKVMDKTANYDQRKKKQLLKMKKEYRAVKKKYHDLSVAEKRDCRQVRLARLEMNRIIIEVTEFNLAFAKELK